MIKIETGKKINNPLDILGKYKIFDNIARMFLYPSVLLLLILSIAKKQYIWLLISCFTMIFPIFLFISNKLYFKRNKHRKRTYIEEIRTGRNVRKNIKNANQR